MMPYDMTDKIRYAVFSGGGAKGAAYPGAYAALSETGVFNNIEAVAGSSAGALTAAFVATGIKPEDFQKLAAETNLKTLLGSQGLSWPAPLFKDATPMYKLVQKTISGNIHNFFTENKDISKSFEERKSTLATKQLEIEEQIKRIDSSKGDQNTNQSFILKHEYEELKRRQEKLEAISKNPNILTDIQNRAANNQKITFGDLGYLRALDPTKFKDLLVTAVDRKSEQLKIFSPERTPNDEIAIAVKASASIPVVFQPTKINGKDYIDGGCKDNVPLEYFKNNFDLTKDTLGQIKKDSDKSKTGRILTFAFATNDDNKANAAIYSQDKIDSGFSVEKYLLYILYAFVKDTNAAKLLNHIGMGGVLNDAGWYFKSSEGILNNYQELRDNAPNVVVLNTKDVDTLSFDKANQCSDYLQTKAKIDTLNYINNWNLTTNPLPNLDKRTFGLELYEEIHKKHPELSKKYLEYAKEKSWDGKNPSKIFQDLINKSQVDGVSNLIMDKLNARSTPNNIKRHAINSLGIKGDDFTATQLLSFKFSTDQFKQNSTVYVKNQDGKSSVANNKTIASIKLDPNLIKTLGQNITAKSQDASKIIARSSNFAIKRGPSLSV